MTTINITNARKQLFTLIEEVIMSHQPVHVTSKKGGAVIVAEEDWSAIMETLQLMQIPGMADSIKKGLKMPLDDCEQDLKW